MQWSKLDPGLASLYSNWLQVAAHGVSGVGWVHPAIRQGATGAHVMLRYDGPLAAIEREGFQTTWSDDPHKIAYGIVRFDNIEALADYPGVLRLSYGRQGRPRLNRSIPLVKADQVRMWEDPLHDWDGYAGRDVIVAVLDTGVDIGHDFLQRPRASDSDEHFTRIVRIWDPGLDPTGGEHSPRAELISGRPTYGVEYVEDDINNTLNNRAGITVRHRDCSGHGTHVCSIAAGNGGRARTYVGMAPLAQIVFVKMLYLEKEPMPGGAVISYDQRFADAVDYVFNVARLDLGDKPVVINYSVGDEQGPHDGLSDREMALTHTLDANPTRVFVAAAGNAQGHGSKSHITVPADAMSLTVPYVLVDVRGASNMTEYDTCSVKDTAVPIDCEIWYASPPPAPVTGVLEIEGVAAPIPIPDLGGHMDPLRFGTGQTVALWHQQQAVDVGGVHIERNVIRMEVTPSNNRYQAGDMLHYTFRLTVSPGQQLYTWGEQHGGGIITRIDSDNPAAASFDFASEIDLPASSGNVIAVGAYMWPNTNPDPMLIAIEFSSKGPLVSYNAAWTPPPKPDLGAPGDEIMASQSRFATRPGFCVKLPRHDATQTMSGTSMASPHVAGLVALMFEKNPHMTRADVRAAFRFLTTVTNDPPTLGSGVVDADATLTAVPNP